MGSGKELMRERTHAASQHRTDEEAGSEDAARIAGCVACGGGDQFKEHEQQHQSERHLSIESGRNVAVADSHYSARQGAPSTR